jgi:hypothetical protein
MTTENPYTPPAAKVGERGAHRMKTRIQKFSPHQNAKVFAVLMAVSSLIFLVPFALFANAIVPDGQALPMSTLLLVPVVYLVFGYISVVIGCCLYNLLVKLTGGIEFETQNVE